MPEHESEKTLRGRKTALNIHAKTSPAGDAMHPEVARLLAGGDPAPASIARFLKENDFPLIEPGAATFAWAGTGGTPDLVRWIHGGADRTPFVRAGATDLWLLRLPVEDHGRFEYKIILPARGGMEMIVDPLNPQRASDPYGENSVCRTFGYARPAWSEPGGAPAGRIETITIDSAAFGEQRIEQVYLPAGYAPGQPYPLVIIHDGDDYVEYADLAVSLDNLIASGDIPPVVAALVQTRDRMGEYPRGRRHARYLVLDLLPALNAAFSLSDRPEDHVLLGASLGAVASLATAFRYPGVFGGLVLKSGSFILDKGKLERRPHPVFHRVERLVRALRRAPELPQTRAFVSTGELEGLADENRALALFLREHGVDVLFKSAWDGHHWHNWRDQLRDGLRWVLRSGDEQQS
jgi:enterochelin esterase family protein